MLVLAPEGYQEGPFPSLLHPVSARPGPTKVAGPRHAPARKSRSMSMPDDAVQRMFERCWRTWSGAVRCC
eukprot:scaffold50268_cov28-Phaeocystis_antarctica.AAC.2